MRIIRIRRIVALSVLMSPAPFSTRLESTAARIMSRKARERIPDLAFDAKLWYASRSVFTSPKGSCQ